MVFVWRGAHTGYVCSGYYQDPKVLSKKPMQSIYETSKGSFLNFMMWFNATLLTLVFFCIIGGIVWWNKNKDKFKKEKEDEFKYVENEI